MKIIAVWLTLILPFFSFAQKTKTMNDNIQTIRLIYPQWQGGVIESWFPDLKPEEAARGYYLGAQLLNFLAPQNGQKTVEVPISLSGEDLATEQGVHAKKAILKQTKSALEILQKENPKQIVTLGGECSVSVVPFAYLAEKYKNDVALIWIDAHPDINIPGDGYTGYHAMAVTALLGQGDKDIVGMLPSKIKPQNTLIVGLRSLDEDAQKRFPTLGMDSISPSELRKKPSFVLDWLKKTGASKVLIHFDLDVLDPEEIYIAVGKEPNGMKMAEVITLINEISDNKEVVGLTVADHFPLAEIKIKNMLHSLPILKQ